MNKFQYFFLMLKQGIKGVFRFKAQFTIILILSFLATAILAVSVSTTRRINDSYDRIVKPVAPFDYETQLRVGVSSTTGDVESGRFQLLPLNSIIQGDFAAIYQDSNNLSDATTRYNFILSRPDTYRERQAAIGQGNNRVQVTNHRNFINQSYRSTAFKEAFLGPNDTEHFFATRLVLLNTLLKQLDVLSSGNSQVTGDDNLKYSPIGNYTVKNPYWYAPFLVKNDKGDYEFVDWIKNNDFLTRRNNLHGKDFSYFYFLIKAVDSVLTFFQETSIQMNPFMEERYNERMTKSQLYAFIFGEKANESDQNIPVEWLINPDGSNQYSIWFEPSKAKSDYVFLNQPSDDVNSRNFTVTSLLAKNGLRGVLAPMIDFESTNMNDWTHLQPVSYTQNLSVTFGNNFFKAISVFADPNYYLREDLNQPYLFNLNTSIDKNVFFSVYMISHNLAGEMFNYDVKIRREATYFDANIVYSYRGIILEELDNYNNFTVLKGRGLIPNDGTGEILLSEQFPLHRDHKIPVGTVIAVANATYAVVGYGTDAFSFLPSQDALNPLPNPALSTFIYGSAETIQRLASATPSKASAYDLITETLNFFYWDKGPKATSDIRRSGYFAALNQSPTNLNLNQNLIHNYLDNKPLNAADPEITNVSTSVYNLVSFGESNYRYSWNMPPLVSTIFLWVSVIASVIIIVIVLSALVICVKKTVQFNAKQIGILKAMGAAPPQISISYISHGLVIIFLAVPLGWISGTLLQIPFAIMFQDYFSIFPDMIFMDWISFLVAFIFIGGFAILIGYLSAYYLTNTSVMKILANPIKWHTSKFLTWIKLKILHNSSFKVRFSLTLSSAGSRQIWLMSFVLLITSILVTTSLIIPSVAQTANRLFYRNIQYSNQYGEQELTVNTPLSKSTVSYWEGHPALERDYNSSNPQIFDASGTEYGYYEHPESYFATISNAMVLPEYFYHPKDNSDANSREILANTFIELAKNNDSQLLSYLTDIFGNNFYNNVGVGFSIGMIDSLYGIILHSLDSFVDGETDNWWTDEEKLSYTQDFSAWLTSSIPNLIATIMNTTGGDLGDSEDSDSKVESWKDQIMRVLLTSLPSYVRGYVEQSASRKDQYAITYGNEIYIPEEETLITTIDGKVSGREIAPESDIRLTGLDLNQTAINISEQNKSKIYLSNDVIQQIQTLLNEPNYSSNITTRDGKMIYNATTKTLTLPVLPNRQAQSKFHFRKNATITDFTSKSRQLKFLMDKNDGSNSEYIVLPQLAWLYDDTSYATLAANNTNFRKPNYVEEKAGKSYLNPYELDNNKFSFKSEYQLNDQSQDTPALVDRAFLFKDYLMQNDAITTFFARPYYQYKDLKLFLPMSYITDINEVLYPNGKGNKVEDPNIENTSWYEIMKTSDVPEIVKKAWSNVQTDEYLVINPYDLKYFAPDFELDIQKKANGRDAVNNLINGPGFWYLYANSGLDTKMFTVEDDVTTTFVNKDVKINFESQGVIQSFNSDLLVIDSNLANLLMNLPLTRHYQYDYKIFSDEKILANTVDKDGYTSQFTRFYPKGDEVFIEANTGENLWKPRYTTYKNNLKAQNYAPHRWYNGKLSNVDEPLSFSTTVAYSGQGRLGLYAIGKGAWTGGVSIHQLVNSSTLLSQQRALMAQISGLAIAISSLLLVAIIVTSSLLIMLVGDIYIAQYRQFMVLMKSLGYSNKEIMAYSLGTASIFALIMLGIGHAIGWIFISIVITVFDQRGFALPFGFNWWVIPAFILIMVSAYVISLGVSSHGARKDPPTKILAQTNE